MDAVSVPPVLVAVMVYNPDAVTAVGVLEIFPVELSKDKPAGRAGDTGKDPVPEFINSIRMAKRFNNVNILWASVREPYNYLQAKQLGCHIITVPPSIIEKIENFGKSFDQLTKETVKAFLVDSKKSNFKI